MGSIDESSLDKLSLVTDMTRHIRVKAKEAGELISEHVSTYS